MSVIQVQGLHKLKGEIRIQGSKNTVLPVMAASLLHRGITVITNVPRIQDVFCMMENLKRLGCSCEFQEHCMVIDATTVSAFDIPYEESRKMRSSILLLGPLLGRLGEVRIGFPGGCSIGSRPVDFHLQALKKMGAEVETSEEWICAHARKLQGCEIYLKFPSVGATENILMAAAKAKGTTRIFGAAREPEIVWLCRFLKQMGIKLQGEGTDTIEIYGSCAPRDTEFQVPGDRIVTGTYLGAVMTAGGELLLSGAPESELLEVFKICRQMGVKIRAEEKQIYAERYGKLSSAEVVTAPFPGFPTDLQPVIMAAAMFAEGNTGIIENVFEERFATAKELQKLGAHIIIDGRQAEVRGSCPLAGTRVYARDLRGGAALVVAALGIDGKTLIDNCHYIQRGYEDICADLAAAGAEIGWAD